MQQRRTRLPELPEFGEGDMLFTLKDIAYTPAMPRKNVPFTVTGKIELFSIPYVLPIWIVVKVTYPEEWWEEIIPIWGSPTVGEGQTALGGDFEVKFPRGFDREGEFALDVEAHLGPTFTVDKMTIPPFPPMASQAMTFIVAGEVPPEEVGFRTFRILSYSKNGGPPVTPPGVLELDIGDRCRLNVGFDHINGEVTGEFHAAIGNIHGVPIVDIEWFDEVLNAKKPFTVPSSPDWVPVEDFIDIIITSAISPGSYDLYVKIMGITGGDIFTEPLNDVITIVGVPPEEKMDFDLTKPSPSISRSDPGTQIELTCPVTSRCTMPVDAEAKVIIYEGSIMPGHGTKITEYDSSIPQINPNETVDVIIQHTTVEGTIDRRDVEVEIYVEGNKIKESEWDDVFYVNMPPELETLEVRIDPPGAGHVTTSPEPAGGVEHNWQFPYGTTVYVTAHPANGYVFESWSGEMTDTTAVTAPVYPMTEHRLITAHFQLEEVPPPTTDIKNFDFQAQRGTYDMGEGVSFTAPYEYKGKAQSGYLTISLGTGVAPSFLTKHTFPRIRVSFDETMDWAPGELSGNFTLPTTLKAGQTYNVRAKLETDDGKQETDTDWGVINIAEVAPPPPPPPPASDIKNFDFRAQRGTYKLGERVSFSAPYEYKGKAQSGYLTISLGTGVYPSFFTKHTFPRISVTFKEAMDWTAGSLSGNFTLPTTLVPGQTYNVRAKLKTADGAQETDTDWGVITIEEAAPPEEQYTLELASEPFIGGNIIDEPDKPYYSYGEIVKLTADPFSLLGYRFSHWTFDGEWMGTSNPINLMMTRSGRVTAYFIT